ncbi:protein of unknown function [uncultured Sphingopyxis sp.]|uniref:Uncharacterized protein n=1 Tax=uncultured Sphingopyxis sp. TaxID=310581 RepID=A0A1Y5PX49_9SPHN|nr:protein of unknown function [uncultured Sphingopyxis sp.]
MPLHVGDLREDRHDQFTNPLADRTKPNDIEHNSLFD